MPYSPIPLPSACRDRFVAPPPDAAFSPLPPPPRQGDPTASTAITSCLDVLTEAACPVLLQPARGTGANIPAISGGTINSACAGSGCGDTNGAAAARYTVRAGGGVRHAVDLLTSRDAGVVRGALKLLTALATPLPRPTDGQADGVTAGAESAETEARVV